MAEILLIGNYSVGKSSLINYLSEIFDLKIKVDIGLCETTNEKCSYLINNIKIIDLPGLNTENVFIENYKKEIVTSFYIFIIVTSSSFKSKEVLQYINYCKNNRIYEKKKHLYYFKQS